MHERKETYYRLYQLLVFDVKLIITNTSKKLFTDTISKRTTVSGESGQEVKLCSVNNKSVFVCKKCQVSHPLSS